MDYTRIFNFIYTRDIAVSRWYTFYKYNMDTVYTIYTLTHEQDKAVYEVNEMLNVYLFIDHSGKSWVYGVDNFFSFLSELHSTDPELWGKIKTLYSVSSPAEIAQMAWDYFFPFIEKTYIFMPN